jgi:hypothetical protein
MGRTRVIGQPEPSLRGEAGRGRRRRLSSPGRRAEIRKEDGVRQAGRGLPC